MPILAIRLYGDPVLREKAAPVAAVDDSLRKLAASMGETMYAAAGIGLAANQVGETRRIIVYDTAQLTGSKTKEGKRARDITKMRLDVMLNPEIVESSHEDEQGDEGCLSIPGLDAQVYRAKRVRVKFRDLDWRERDEWFEATTARVLQHEIDHLDGILFIDRLPAAKRATMAAHLAKVRKGEVPSALEAKSAGVLE